MKKLIKWALIALALREIIGIAKAVKFNIDLTQAEANLERNQEADRQRLKELIEHAATLGVTADLSDEDKAKVQTLLTWGTV